MSRLSSQPPKDRFKFLRLLLACTANLCTTLTVALSNQIAMPPVLMGSRCIVVASAQQMAATTRAVVDGAPATAAST